MSNKKLSLGQRDTIGIYGMVSRKACGMPQGFQPPRAGFLRAAPIRNWLKRRAWRLDELLHGNMNCAVHMNLLRNELSQAT